MLFSMVERGANGEVIGDKGKFKATNATHDAKPFDGEEALWAIILTKELWKKSIWFVAFFFLKKKRYVTDQNAGMTQKQCQSCHWVVFTLSPKSKVARCTFS